jgi:competence protein ComEC
MSHRLVKWLWTMLAVSCAAQLGTAPLVAYYFGRFPTLFLVTNLVVIPAATLILYLSLVVLFVPSVAYLLYNIVTILNTFLERMALLPWVSIEGCHPSVLQTIMVYVVIAAVYVLIDKLSCVSRMSS